MGFRDQFVVVQLFPLMFVLCWVLSPLSNSWITNIIWLYIALDRTPNIDCYWVGAAPKFYGSELNRK